MTRSSQVYYYPQITDEKTEQREDVSLHKAVKNLPANAGDAGSIPGSGRSPGVENGNPFQYSCLGNPMDRRAWWATAHGGHKSRTQLSIHAHI